MFGFKRRRRERLRRQPLPDMWLKILQRNVGHYRALSEAERAELCGHIQVFMHEKCFEGCGGLTLTDEIRVTIAALGCLLLLGRESDYYRKLRSILVYPHRYLVETTQRLPGGLVVESDDIRLGESWQQGIVVLSWEDVQRDTANITDGRNVALHEFAHQLDSETGATEGAPLLPEGSMYAEWGRVFQAEYTRLIDDLEHRRPTLLSPYGAKSPAEFFAVVTETFFEQPRELRDRHAHLYDQMRLYYQQDPAARLERLTFD
ncbi:MAG: zinc-dependent peptidase [Phycisphaerae bacterium]|nr:zinc-dependent peptidase [Phycisphaerae bacterium]